MVVAPVSREFDLESVINSYTWLGHRGAYTEVNAFHPMYRPGRQNYEHNRIHQCFPVVRYVRDEWHLLNLVGRLHGSHMVCYGINPRLGVKRYPSGHPRAHRDSEIEVVKNFFFDFDLPERADRERIAELELFLEMIMGRLEDMGLGMPVKAFTGNGFHLLFAIPEMRVEECPDIKERIKAFREEVLRGLEGRLTALSATLDSTDDLSRMAKVYGTAKPGGKVLSRFYGEGRRVEDVLLRERLLGMKVYRNESRGLGLEGMREFPESFSRLLSEDERVRNLWLGHGKTTGDLSRTGYDYSLLRECLARGITDVRELAAILALRPRGAVSDGRKGDQYIRATIGKVIKDCRWGKA